MNQQAHQRILIIAGSDSGGGAGIQADIKTITMLGGYAMSAITAITAQNTQGVHGIHPIPQPIIAQQIAVVMEDIGADAIKIGMLGSAETIHTVTSSLQPYIGTIPIIIDPVMQAKGGGALLEASALAAMKEQLIPIASLLTPNIPEAEALTGQTIANRDDMLSAAETLHQMGAAQLLLKGGHGRGATLSDLAYDPVSAPYWLTSERIDTPHTHGTGCTMASAMAYYLASGHSLSDAAKAAHAYIREAILAAPGFGHGHGPLAHNAQLTHNARLTP